jgi:hypothetical protein
VLIPGTLGVGHRPLDRSAGARDTRPRYAAPATRSQVDDQGGDLGREKRDGHGARAKGDARDRPRGDGRDAPHGCWWTPRTRAMRQGYRAALAAADDFWIFSTLLFPPAMHISARARHLDERL